MPERVMMSGGEVKTVPYLDKLTPQFWALRNQALAGSGQPSAQWGANLAPKPVTGPSLRERATEVGALLRAKARGLKRAASRLRMGESLRDLVLDPTHLTRPPYSR